MHVMFRIKVTGREHLPKEGAYLLCSNHLSVFDPVSLALQMKPQPRFMAKKELFRKRFPNWFWRKLGAYPIDRAAQADMAAYRTTMDTLKKGQPVIIFSQGTRMKEFDNAKGGVAVFALKAGVPIVPAGIRGTYRLFSRMEIEFGPPISLEEYAGEKIKTEIVNEVMEKVVKSVSALVE
jgi:1-acyl-sn-glycerol-3-phosphate acyltransferase